MKDTQIRALKAENGKPKHRAISNGLFIEARPSRKKIFIFRYQWNKKPQTITLGQYPTLTLGEANVIALEYRELLLKDIDPRSKDSEEPRKLTFSEVAEQWHQKNRHLWKDVTNSPYALVID